MGFISDKDSGHLWDFLDSIFRYGAPLCDWQGEVSDLEFFNRFCGKFLERSGERAIFVKCRTECDLGCPRRVILHSYGNFIATCSGTSSELPYKLTKKGVQVYGVNYGAFLGRICDGLGISYDGGIFDKVTGIYFLGEHLAVTGQNFPVFFYLDFRCGNLLKGIRDINLLVDGAYILVILVHEKLTIRAQELLKRRGSICIVLSEEFNFRSDGDLEAKRLLSDIV